jgi:integrase
LPELCAQFVGFVARSVCPADSAIHVLERVEASAKKDGYQEFPIQFTIGKIRSLSALPNNQGRQQAKALLQVALDDARRQEIPGAQTDLLEQAGVIAMEENNPRIAEQSFSEQVRLAKQSDLPSMEADGLLRLSRLYRSEQKNTKAEVAINDGIEVVRRVEESYDLPGFIAEKAEVELALGHLKTADALYDAATHLIEGLLVNAPSSRVKSSMIGSMSEIYLGHFRLAWNQLHDGPKAFEIIERARGRALLGTLSSTQASDGRIDKSPAEVQIAILATLLYHGIRREELCSLRIKDMQTRQGVVHFRITAKREKIRFVPVHASAQRLIGEYLALLGHGVELQGPLFRPVTNNRTGTLDKHLDPGSVYRNIVIKYGQETGIAAQVNGLCVHSLRATAATNALAHESDIAKVQEWLGHSNVSATRLYDRRKSKLQPAAPGDQRPG